MTDDLLAKIIAAPCFFGLGWAVMWASLEAIARMQ